MARREKDSVKSNKWKQKRGHRFPDEHDKGHGTGHRDYGHEQKCKQKRR